MKKTRLFLAALLLAGTAQIEAQTQMANAVKICDEGCTITSIPASATVQFGTSSAPGVWAPAVSLPANALPIAISYAGGANAATAIYAPNGDPDRGVVKELDAQRGTAAYTVGWNDAEGVAHTTTVPALPPPVALTAAPGTVVPLMLTNVQPLSNSPAIPVLQLFGVQAPVLVGGVLSNFSWQMTVGGSQMACIVGALGTDGSIAVNCTVLSTATP